ncbi:MAG: hypothetical protein HY901_25000 [Deltaproteobacteria bacterium]|nr:hypothetical protein [Deltaproteobacteria bacterium]
MTARRRRLALAHVLSGALLLCACSRADRPLASTAADRARAPVPSAGPDAEVHDPLPRDEVFVPDPVGRSGLGQPCPGGADSGLDRTYLAVFCDESGRISGVVMPVDVLHGVPPPRAEVLHEHPDPRDVPGQSLTVAVEGERLWIRRVTCGRCRRVMGWSMVGDLPRMRAEDLVQVQARLGLPAEPVLRDARAWREASRTLTRERLPAGRSPW